jgi:hypothetical protein
MERTDIGMTQRGNGVDLSRESIGKGFGGDFDRDIASHAWVACAIHLTHSAFADGFEDLVGSELAAWIQGHSAGNFSTYPLPPGEGGHQEEVGPGEGFPFLQFPTFTPANLPSAPSVVCAAFNPRRKSASENVANTSVGWCQCGFHPAPICAPLSFSRTLTAATYS